MKGVGVCDRKLTEDVLPEGSFSADRDTGEEDREQRKNVLVMQPLSAAFRAQ